MFVWQEKGQWHNFPSTTAHRSRVHNISTEPVNLLRRES